MSLNFTEILFFNFSKIKFLQNLLMENFFPFWWKKILSNFDAINCLLVYYSKMIFFPFCWKNIYIYLKILLLFFFYWDLFSSNLLKKKLFKLYRGKISIKVTERKFFLLTLLLEKFYWRKGSFNYNEKIFQLYGGKKLFQSFLNLLLEKSFRLYREKLCWWKIYFIYAERNFF